MAKRSDFERRARGFYRTPREAVKPLLPHLAACSFFDEPCAGDGALIAALEEFGHTCGYACDIEPQNERVSREDARNLVYSSSGLIITNPPWPEGGKRGNPTVEIAQHLKSIADTWLLLPADFLHCLYFTRSGLFSCCDRIVSVGRVSWEGNGVKGKDNAAWYLFLKDGHSRDAPLAFGLQHQFLTEDKGV